MYWRWNRSLGSENRRPEEQILLHFQLVFNPKTDFLKKSVFGAFLVTFSAILGYVKCQGGDVTSNINIKYKMNVWKKKNARDYI